YREIAEVSTPEQFDRIKREWRDRFGKFPEAGGNPFFFPWIKIVAPQTRLTPGERGGRKTNLTPKGGIFLFHGEIPSFSCENPPPRGGSRANKKIYMIRQVVLPLITACLVNLSPICRAAYAAQPEAEVVDGVAAVVNGDVITYSQVRNLVGSREKL